MAALHASLAHATVAHVHPKAPHQGALNRQLFLILHGHALAAHARRDSAGTAAAAAPS